ncbi:MAG: NAD(P)H-hydrate dehydratase [Pseudomonadales bacterium]|nr:NAD(P)H-hydrate dehydratase [Pseudomonadales bacterium]
MESLYNAAQCRALDRLAIDQQATPGFTLMTRAGQAALDCLLERWPDARALTVCCGKGNNAGDGYVVAALARRLGLAVELLQVGDPAALEGDAALARDMAQASGVAVAGAWPDAPAGDVVVDALLGTGLRGPLRPPYAAAVNWINGSGRPVLALDLPTGVDADTGSVTDPVVRAAVTISFIGRKLGLYTGPGRSVAGARRFAGLGVGAPVYRQVDGCPLLEYPELPAAYRVPARDPGAYKQSFGHVLVVGGDHSMGGAPLMAAEAALRTGAGLVTVVTRAGHRPAILARRPETMVVDADDPAARRAALDRATCLVVGPGLGRGPWGCALLEEALASGKPALVDADGLYGLRDLSRAGRGPLIVTPHPGEAAALLGGTSAAVQADRLHAARTLVSELDAVVVLKGAGTVVAAPDGGGAPRVLGICAHGNPGMASAGMGDVLSGVIGGLLAQGLAPAAAAVAGTCLHSLAADQAVQRVGERSLLATDLLEPMIAILAGETRH